MPVQNYKYRYEMDPGRYVYVQTESARVQGRAIIKQILKRYEPDAVFYHLHRRGGHVAALRLHQESAFFSRFDIAHFFGQITRTRISRTMRAIGFKRSRAFNIAMDSVVVEGGRKVLPFGFRQSPVLATACLEASHLGGTLKELKRSGILVSVYMDDILLSHRDQERLRIASERVVSSADAAGFPLGETKRTVAERVVDAFNCQLAEAEVSILDSRMEQFIRQHQQANPVAQAAIERYIQAVSADELRRFVALL